MSTFEYRVCWHGGTVGSDGGTDWEPWDGDEGTAEAVKEAINASTPGEQVSLAEELFWNGSGAEFWSEVRDAEEAPDEH